MNIFPNLLLNTKLNPMLNIETGVRRKKFILGGVNLISTTIYLEYIKLDRDKSTFKSHRDFSSEKEITFKHS